MQRPEEDIPSNVLLQGFIASMSGTIGSTLMFMRQGWRQIGGEAAVERQQCVPLKRHNHRLLSLSQGR